MDGKQFEWRRIREDATAYDVSNPSSSVCVHMFGNIPPRCFTSPEVNRDDSSSMTPSSIVVGVGFDWTRIATVVTHCLGEFPMTRVPLYRTSLSNLFMLLP